jgi:hypothetical protein
MAKKVTLEIDVDSTGAVKAVNEVAESVEKVAQKSADSTKKASQGFASMAGNIVKSLGVVALLVKAFEMVKEAFTGTQRGADLFNTVMGTISTMLKDFVNFIFDNFGKVVDFFKQVFENPIESIKKLGDLIKENLIERFNSLLDTFGYLGEALSKLFTGDFSGAWESVKKAGKESIDIITGVNNTVDRTTKAIGEAADAIADYTKKVWDQNAALVEAKKQAEIAAALANKLKEQKDREAEQLRNIRDEERNSITERIEANNKLLVVLDDLEKQSLKLADIRLREASLQYKLSGLSSDYAKLIQAEAEKEAVRAAVASQRSEQLQNDLALNREYNDMLKTQAEATAELQVSNNKFAADTIKNDIERIKAQRAVLDEERKIQLERLQNEINRHKLGTQARVDAEIAYNAKKLELDQAVVLKDQELKDAEIKRLNEINTSKINLITDLFQRERAALELEYAEKYRLAYNDSQRLEVLEKEKALKLRGIRQAEMIKYAQMTSDGLGVLMQINDAFDKKDEASARKRFKLNKALGIAQATINTFMAVNAALTAGGNPAKLATGIQFVEAGLALATGIANVIKIEQTKFEAGSTGSAPSGESNLGAFSQGGGGGAPGLTAQNTVTQLNPDGTVAGQGNREMQPMKAYVVESESRAVTERVNKLSNQSKI